jgi:hypothetical protein
MSKIDITAALDAIEARGVGRFFKPSDMPKLVKALRRAHRALVILDSKGTLADIAEILRP